MTTPTGRREPQLATPARWTRIPLIGDVAGIVLVLPAEPLSPENWAQFMRCLDAMRPGLVAGPPAPATPTEEKTR